MQNNDPRIIKLLKLIDALRKSQYTLDQLMEIISVDQYTLYRYLDLLRDVNFDIGKDVNGHYCITIDEESRYPELTGEEAALLHLFTTPDPANPLTLSNPNHDKLKHNESLVARLTFAIRNKHQVILYEYMVNHDGPLEHLIEPIYFSDYHHAIIALDTRDLKCKQFLLGNVRTLSVEDEPFSYEVLHAKHRTDIFRIAGEPSTWITLHLHEDAYLDLVEQYPLALPYVTSEKDYYVFHGPVVSFAGIGRFVADVLYNVDIVEPLEFEQYVFARINALGNDVMG